MTHAIDGIAADLHTPGVGRSPTTPPFRRGDAPPSARVIALPELHGAGADEPRVDATAPGPQGAGVLRDWSPLHQIKARLQVCVGEATLTVGELLAAKEQQVLQLDRTLDQPVDLSIEGKVVARGQLVAVDGHFAVRITELPAPLNPFSGP